MHLIHMSQAPSYLTDIVTQTASVTSQTWLQSSSGLRYEQLRTQLKFGQRAFFYAALAAWNSLPLSCFTVLITVLIAVLMSVLSLTSFYTLYIILDVILALRFVVHHWSFL